MGQNYSNRRVKATSVRSFRALGVQLPPLRSVAFAWRSPAQANPGQYRSWSIRTRARHARLDGGQPPPDDLPIAVSS